MGYNLLTGKPAGTSPSKEDFPADRLFRNIAFLAPVKGRIEVNLSVNFLHFLYNGLPIHAVFQNPDYRNGGIFHDKKD